MKVEYKTKVNVKSKKRHLTEDEVNIAITFYLAIQTASETVSTLIKKGIIRQEQKLKAKNFINYWTKQSEEFWAIFKDDDNESPHSSTTEIIEGLENMHKVLPNFARLSTTEVHIVNDFMERILNCEFHLENTVYDFSEPYLHFKYDELIEALGEQLRLAIDEDFEGLTITIDGRETTVKGDPTNKDCGGKALGFLTDRGHFPIYDTNAMSLLSKKDIAKINNYLYDKIKVRTGRFDAYSQLVINNCSYDFDRFLDYDSDGNQIINWRYSVGNEPPVHGKSFIEIEDGRDKYIIANKQKIYLRDLTILEKNNTK